MNIDISKWNLDVFGDGNSFSDPAWYQGQYSPYYKESHKKLRAFVRKMVDEEIMPNCHDWDEAKKIPNEMYKRMGSMGLNFLSMGHPYPVEYQDPPEILKGEEIDVFHEMIVIDELSRCGAGGVTWGLAGGLTIGLPPVLRFGTEELKKRVVPDCLAGEKIICLAITEPTAGSDVANIKATAKKFTDAKDGKEYYLVNGEKKWITNGVFADYFTVAVRTGEKGAKGISMLLIERSAGVKTKQMQCSGVWCSGTTYITFDDVKVPVENLIGREGKGFQQIMQNFNHERMAINIMTNRFSRVCLEESIKFANKRKTFGQKLNEHAVIRWKIAEMARMIEASHAWLEHLLYNIHHMDKIECDLKLGGLTALAKVQCTKVFEYCARESAQIFGGLSYSRGGQGEKVERLNREVRAMAIPGGSEEIMLDLGVRQTEKMAKMAKQMLGDGSKM